MLKFKNIGQGVHAIKRADLGGPLIEATSTIEVDGTISSETEDAYIVGEGDNARAWPKSQWELVKSAAKSASAKEN